MKRVFQVLVLVGLGVALARNVFLIDGRVSSWMQLNPLTRWVAGALEESGLPVLGELWGMLLGTFYYAPAFFLIGLLWRLFLPKTDARSAALLPLGYGLTVAGDLLYISVRGGVYFDLVTAMIAFLLLPLFALNGVWLGGRLQKPFEWPRFRVGRVLVITGAVAAMLIGAKLQLLRTPLGANLGHALVLTGLALIVLPSALAGLRGR